MFKVMLMAQWKWTRLLLLPAVVVGFALPILLVQHWDSSEASWYVIRESAAWGVWFAAFAGAVGLLVGTSAWMSDHRGGHVYALSLPVERWRYVLLRYGSGALLLVAPILSMWIGALLATASVELQVGLNAYPNSLALRFALATFVSYSIFFAISSATSRTAGYILTVIGGVVIAELLLNAVGAPAQLIDPLLNGVLNWPGPLEVFTGRWLLIDV
jgi:hypothetical protein